MRKMKKYVVALISFFDNSIEQFKIEAEDELSAVKKAMLLFCKSDIARESEIAWQNSDEYPKTFEELQGNFPDWEMDCSVIEVGSFINE